jgi:CheY-like chemotaxis protein
MCPSIFVEETSFTILYDPCACDKEHSVARILVAEDSRTQAANLKILLERENYDVQLTTNGREAFEAIKAREPDLVLTDLQMPEMNGLQLVEEIVRSHQTVPVILMTEYGNEDIATEALRIGAVSYIPKRRLQQDLFPTLGRVLGLSRSDFKNQNLLNCWVQSETSFVLGNNPELFPSLIGYFRDCLTMMKFGDESTMIRLSVALTEALDNAVYHGNLELKSEWKQGDASVWMEEREKRRKQWPYQSRHIHVEARLSREEAYFTIRDEGPGFDVSKLPDPTDPEFLERPSGRGIFLIRTFVDEFRHNDTGNEVTIIKRRRK